MYVNDKFNFFINSDELSVVLESCERGTLKEYLEQTKSPKSFILDGQQDHESGHEDDGYSSIMMYE